VIRESSRPRRPDATVAAFAGSAARDDN
jgi:hypothetical protein